MKTIKVVIFFILFFSINLFANSQYNFKYDLISNNKKIGTLESNCIKNKNNIYKYTTKLNMKYQFVFMNYEYKYVEEAYIKDGKLQSLIVYEKDDDTIKNIKAKRDGDFLVYTNGIKVDMRKIDYLPFDYKSKSYENKVTSKNFTLTTFDPLTGNIYLEKNFILDSSNSDLIKIKTIGYNNSVEERTILKDGTLINFKNEFFEAKLVK